MKIVEFQRFGHIINVAFFHGSDFDCERWTREEQLRQLIWLGMLGHESE